MLSFRLRTNQGTKSCSCIASASAAASSVHGPSGGVAVQSSPVRSSSDNCPTVIHTPRPNAGGGGGGDDSDKENCADDDDSDLGGDRKSTSNGLTSKRMEPSSSGWCLKCLERFEQAVRRIEPGMERQGTTPRNSQAVVTTTTHPQAPPPPPPQQQYKKSKPPREFAPLQISISVVDPDNNNVDLCPCWSGTIPHKNANDEDQVDQAKVCPRCHKFSNESGRSLVTKRLTLANDIIVNRVDSQFLNAAGAGGGVAGSKGGGMTYEPYTPDSMESHSPMMMMMLMTGDRLSADLRSSSSSSSFTNSTTIRGSSSDAGSVDSGQGRDSGSSGRPDPVNVITTTSTTADLIDEDATKRPELKTMSSVEMTSGGPAATVAISTSSPGVNAKQLKTRLEKLQILSRMPGHGGGGGGGVASNKSDFGGRFEFENQMRKREEKKELKELKRAEKKRKKVLCCYQEEQQRTGRGVEGTSGIGMGMGTEKSRRSKGQCSVM